MPGDAARACGQAELRGVQALPAIPLAEEDHRLACAASPPGTFDPAVMKLPPSASGR